jgi:hypothetical protein
MEFVDICWVLRTMMRGSRVNKYEHVTEKQTHQTFQGWDMPLQYSRILYCYGCSGWTKMGDYTLITRTGGIFR